MAGLRPSRPGRPSSRPLLNLKGGDKPGLAKALQALVGVSPEGTPATTFPDGQQIAQALEILKGLGFQSAQDEGHLAFTHPLAQDRSAVCQPPAEPFEPESWTLDWAARHFPEMDFYLPFIMRRAALAKKQPGANGRPTTPEPDYDDDGFLAGYS
ncbi:MAG: hypothetical protein J0I20_03865 [Chloroflexi bacterium]|nr:hypothetical protein [Chloroflexota bacterium]